MADFDNCGTTTAKGKTSTIFQCKYCRTRFAQADELIAHKKKNHLSEIKTERQQRKAIELSKITKPSSSIPELPNLTSNNFVPLSSGSSGNPRYTTEADVRPTFDSIVICSTIKEEQYNEIPSSPETPLKHCLTSNELKTNANEFKCQECDATFNYDYHLIQHMSLHELDKNSNSAEQIKTTAETNNLTTQENELHGNQRSVQNYNLLPCFVNLTQLKLTGSYSKALNKVTGAQNFRKHCHRRIYGVRTYNCKYSGCTKRFQRPRLLKHHVEMFHSGGSHATTASPPLKLVTAASSKDVSNDIRSSHVNHCTIGFKSNAETCSKSSRRNFLTNQSSFKRLLKCPSTGCNFETKHRHGMQRHARHHNIDKPIKCHSCNASFNTKRGRVIHLKTSHASQKIKLPESQTTTPRRNVISTTFKRDTLEMHTQRNLGMPYSCSICTRGFPSLLKLRYHRGMVHGNGWHKCDYCPYESFSGAVANHMKRLHQNKNGNKHRCMYCGATCYTNGTLQRHIAKYHESGSKPTTDTHEDSKVTSRLNIKQRRKECNCSHCPFTAYNSADVKRHMIRTHTERRQYQCHQCSASYDTLQHLQLHLGLHKHEADSTQDKSLVPRIVSVTSGLGSSVTIPRNKEEMMQQPQNISILCSTKDTLIDNEFRCDELDVEGNDANRAQETPFECCICDLALFSAHSLNRHYTSSTHVYNEYIDKQLKGIKTEEAQPRLSNLRFKKLICKICKMVLPTRSKLDGHYKKKHDVISRTKSMKRLYSSKSTAKFRTAVVKSLPPVSQSEGSFMNETKLFPEKIDNYSSSLTDGNYLNSDVKILVPFLPSSQLDDDKKTVTVTQQNSSGLKITSVRYTS